MGSSAAGSRGRTAEGREPREPRREAPAGSPPLLTRVALFVLPFMVLVVLLLLKLWRPGVYEQLCLEDSVIENAQAALFLASSVLAVGMVRRLQHNGRRVLAALYLAAAAGLVFVAGEEVAWGQRLFGFASPGLFQSNDQGEVTLHNLPGMSYVTMIGYVAIGAAGSLGWLLARRVVGRGRDWRLVVPDWYLAPYFLAGAVTYASFPLTHHVGFQVLHVGWMQRGVFFGWPDQEPAELMLAAGIALFLFFARSRIGGRRARASAPPLH